MCFARKLGLSAFLLPGVVAFAGDIEVIYTKIPTHSSSIVPGALDLAGMPAVTNFRAMEYLVMSPDGSEWVLRARTQQGGDLETILMRGSGLTGTMFAQEGQPIPGGAPGELFDFFGSGVGTFNSLNEFAYSARARGGVAAVFQKVIKSTSMGSGIAFQMGDLIMGLVDLPPNPSGDETFGNSVGSIHLLDNGTIGSQDSTILGIHTSRRPAIMYNNQAFHQTGVTQVMGLGSVGMATWSTIDANEFYTTPDGMHWLAEGQLVAMPANVRVLVKDGAAVLQTGEPVGGSSLLLGDIFQSQLVANGDWISRGRDNSGTGAAAPDWAVRNGVLLAKSGDPITTGPTTENWGDTFYAVSTNTLGDWVIAGNTTNSDTGLDNVIVLNGTEVIVREGDPVDLDGNGMFDDDVFIGRGVNTNVAFTANFVIITDQREVYFLPNLRNGAGQDLNSNPVFGTPQAFVRIRLGTPSTLGDMNCDGIVTPGDIAGFVLALTNPAEYMNQFPDCDINNADINGDSVVSPGDIAGFVALLIGP